MQLRFQIEIKLWHPIDWDHSIVKSVINQSSYHTFETFKWLWMTLHAVMSSLDCLSLINRVNFGTPTFCKLRYKRVHLITFMRISMNIGHIEPLEISFEAIRRELLNILLSYYRAKQLTVIKWRVMYFNPWVFWLTVSISIRCIWYDTTDYAFLLSRLIDIGAEVHQN